MENENELWGEALTDEEIVGNNYNEPAPNENPSENPETNEEENLEEWNESEEIENQPNNNDLIDKILSNKGIDKNKIRFENEDGEIEEVSFDDLSDEEKLNILQQEESLISDDELETLNFLRKNNMNLADYIEYQRELAVQDYLAQNDAEISDIKDMSDDELYEFHLYRMMPDITDEESKEQLEKAKENEAFFKKQVDALREQYLELEKQEIELANQKKQQENDAQYNELAQSLVGVAQNTDEFFGMMLEDEDKEEVLSYVLDKDPSGQTAFYKQFENPEMIFKMAWFALKGEEAFNALNDYYKQQISKRTQSAPSNQPRVVHKQNNRTNSAFSI